MTFIAVEGIEGSGKSTLIAGLAEGLRRDGYAVVMTREPGGTRVGNAMREVFLNNANAMAPLTESLLVNAARAQHVFEVIRPALALERIVLCDRFIDSTLAYQGYGRGLRLDTLRELCSIATGGLQPDLVLLLDVPVNVARGRLRERTASDRIEAEGDDFHERVRRGFLELAGEPGHRVLDGTLPPGTLLEQAMEEVRAGLGTRVP
ncbi:MAG TPA: dTMP kinase [Candidatus Babeliales bacterium]|nr:dTMP kinase [Candidatus Babeliales bacterium]